jgi:hypothetical protein
MGKTRKAGKKSLFLPPKYFKGLSKSARTRRVKEIKKYGSIHWKNPAAYKGFETDKLHYIPKKSSSYTEQWKKLFPDAKSLEEKSKATGVPLKILDHIDRKAKAAWRTGHRPGATQQEWSYARLASFLVCGKAHYTADAAEVRRAKKTSAKARKWFKRCKTSKLTKI